MRNKDWFLAVVYGLMIPAVLVSLESVGLKWLVLGLSSLMFFFVAVFVKEMEKSLLLLLALSLCVNLDVNFFISYHFLKLNTLSAGFSLGMADVLLVLLYALWIYRSIEEPQRIDLRLLCFLGVYLVFFLLMMLSIVNSEDVLLSFYELKKRVLPLFAILYIGVNVRTPGLVKKIIGMIFLGMAISSLVGILQYSMGKNFGLSIFGEADEIFEQSVVGSSEIIRRVSGLMPHSNIFGMYLAFTLPIAFSLTFADIEKHFKYFSFVVSLLGSLALLLTFSRAAIMAFVFGMFIFLLVKNRNLFHRCNNKICLMYGVLTGGILFVFWNKLIERFSGSPASNLSFRFFLNEAAFKMIDRHPWLGIGLNNFSIQLPFYDTRGITAVSRFPVHNLYLLIASETGLVSLAVFLLFVMSIICIGISIYRRSPDPFLKSFSLGTICGIVAVLLDEMMDFSFVVQPVYLLFFTICALLLAIRFHLPGKL